MDHNSLIPPLPKGPAPTVDKSGDGSAVFSDDENSNSRPKQEPPKDDGWQAIWEPNIGAYYFYNGLTKETSWINPRAQKDDETIASDAAAEESKEKSIEDQVYEEEQERLRRLKQEQDKLQKKRLNDQDDDEDDDDYADAEKVITPEYIQAAIPQHGQQVKQQQQQRPNRKQIQQFKRIKKERKTKMQRQWLLD